MRLKNFAEVLTSGRLISTTKLRLQKSTIDFYLFCKNTCDYSKSSKRVFTVKRSSKSPKVQIYSYSLTSNMLGHFEPNLQLIMQLMYVVIMIKMCRQGQNAKLVHGTLMFEWKTQLSTLFAKDNAFEQLNSFVFHGMVVTMMIMDYDHRML